MGALEDIKNQFSFQDLGISTALGVLSGIGTSKALGAPFSGTFVSGALLGTASYITDLVPEEHMSPMRSTLFTALTLGLAVFALTKAKARFSTNVLVKVLPAEIKPLVCVAAFNVLGKAMIIYFPVIFPGFRTAPTLPKGLKDLFALPSKEVRACYTYFEGNSDAFTQLPVKAQVALNHAFKSESLSPLTVAPFTATTFDDWEKEDLRMIREREISMGTVEPVFEHRCYTLDLEPPKVVSEAFAIPRTPVEILNLKESQRKWFKTLFESHPAKWDELSPTKQLAFVSFDEFAANVVRHPKTIGEVGELSTDGVAFFHRDFDSKNYDGDVSLALIRRFSAASLKLPENIQAQLVKLPLPATAADVGFLADSEVVLYELLFNQKPDRWNSLDTTIRWAFRAKKGNWPVMGLPSSVIEIQSLSPELTTYFHRNFNIQQTPTPSIREAWYLKFYECDLPPTSEMAQDCARIFEQARNTAPFKNFTNVGDVRALTPAKLKWFEQTYRYYRDAWIALPLNYQTQFRKKVSPTLTFPIFTYPITEVAVTNLDAEAAEEFKKVFQIDIMQSKGRSKFSFGESPLDYQDPRLFSLTDLKRRKILEELGKKLPAPLGPEFDPYIKPPIDPVEIQGLDKNKLEHWARYFKADVTNWNNLPLTVQITYYQQAKVGHVAVKSFPPIFIKNNELKDLVTKANADVAHLDNPYFNAIRLLRDEKQFELEMWVRWPLETQQLLKTAFGHLALDHNDDRVGGAIPNHPTPHGNVAGIIENLAKVYHENFYPSAFAGVDLDNYLQAFIAKFQENLPTHGVLGLGAILLEKIDLKHMTDADRNWAQRILADPGGVVWNGLSCHKQLIYRRECDGFNGAGIPEGTHLYKAPTSDEIPRFNQVELTQLRNFYNTTGPWMTLSPALQTALNERFIEQKLGALPTPWTIDYSYADTKLVARSPNADALGTYLKDHPMLWNALDSRTQTKLNTKFTANIPQDLPFSKGKYYWARFRKGSSFYFQRYVEPQMTRRNLIIGGLATAYIVTDLAGIPNLVPDVILNTAWSIASGVTTTTFGLGWGLVSGIGSLFIGGSESE